MAKKTTQTVRQMAHSTTQSRRIKLRQIVIDGKTDYCHRDDAALNDDKLEPLAESMVMEGARIPMTVAATGKTVTIDEEEYPTFRLVGGYRRFHSIELAIGKNMDPAQYYPMFNKSRRKSLRRKGRRLD